MNKMSQGIGIFDFNLTGSVYKVDDIYSAIGKCKDKIIVVKNATPDIVLLFQEIKGVICEYGGATCHLALLSREMSIPCVVGALGISTIEDGKNVYIKSNGGSAIIYETS